MKQKQTKKKNLSTPTAQSLQIGSEWAKCKMYIAIFFRSSKKKKKTDVYSFTSRWQHFTTFSC